MRKFGFFYKKIISFLSNQLATTELLAKLRLTKNTNELTIYCDQNNNNALTALDSNSNKMILITEGTENEYTN
jgi:hypothetical protein